MIDLLTKKQTDERDQHYFFRQAKGDVPIVDIKVNGADVNIVGDIEITKSLLELPNVIYPGKNTIKFESDQKFTYGSEVILKLYYKGNSIDGQTFFDDFNMPESNYYSMVITKATYSPPTINSSEGFKYECTSDFGGLSDKIYIAVGGTMSEIVNHTSLLDEYSGDDSFTVQLAGEYKVSKVLSDFVEYISYKKGGEYLLEINGSDLSLLEAGKVTDYITSRTSATPVNDVRDLTKTNISGHWGEYSYETFDESQYPTTHDREVRRVNGKVTIVDGGSPAVYRNPETYSFGIGNVLKVENCFVPANDRAGFVAWKVGRENYELTADMVTSFFSSPLGSYVNVEVVPVGKSSYYPAGLGWRGRTTAKTFILGFSDDGARFIKALKLTVSKISAWDVKYFDWGDEWDTGAQWRY